MFCGLCVEACPYDALHMGSGFEEGTYRRSELVIDVERLRKADKKPSTWFRPQLTDKSYGPIKGSEANWDEWEGTRNPREISNVIGGLKDDFR